MQKKQEKKQEQEQEEKHKGKGFCQRHGKFLSIPHGISFGGGQQVSTAIYLNM